MLNYFVPRKTEEDQESAIQQQLQNIQTEI